ncbi:hypothetical protein D3C86_2091650 [compost metagenome]
MVSIIRSAASRARWAARLPVNAVSPQYAVMSLPIATGALKAGNSTAYTLAPSRCAASVAARTVRWLE